jgi:hypothetical protein
MHPHWLATPPPPHVQPPVGHPPHFVASHAPQSIVPPQPSPMGPQLACCAAHDVGMHGA